MSECDVVTGGFPLFVLPLASCPPTTPSKPQGGGVNISENLGLNSKKPSI